MSDERILNELVEIRRYVALLALVTLRPVLGRFEEEVLRTDNRVRIFRAFNGTRTPQEVGELAGVTGQGVRDLIRDLREAGFVSVPDGGPQIASVNYEAILDWHTRRSQS